ncbi:MAG: penicillin acylase family protein [Vicinamibacterales bacterium]
MRRRLLRAVLWLTGLAIAAAITATVGARVLLGRSLPVVDGEVTVPGLSAPVTVARDDLGIPTITAASRVDLARAIGFVHAQDRFFQMDLQRRQPAGELAALVGPAALASDRAQRRHRFRDVARRALAQSAPAYRAELEAYADGVNAGLAALGARPFEYFALRTTPEPWRAEDTVLTLLAMWVTLQGAQPEYERALGALADALPPPMFEFLASRATDWESPIDGPPMPVAPVPGPDVADLRQLPAPRAARATPDAPRPGAWPWWARLPADEDATIGSNNWAVSGARSTTGSAIVANDMHLRLSVPNIWYRATYVVPDETRPGATRTLSGVTLPGGPQLAVGTNGDIAWGFTNTGGDWTDLVVVEPLPGDASRYRTPEGPRAFEVFQESIAVRGGAPVTLDVRWTIWGPIIGRDHRGRELAQRWVAHDAAILSTDPSRIAGARSVDDALRLAVGAAAPAQNLVVGDSAGHIAWTIYGAVPRRTGFTGEVPESWADGSRRWDGYLGFEEHPRVVDPPEGYVWTANARVVGGAMGARIGDGGFADGIRAWMIRDDLARLEKADERAMFAIQLDDRSVFLERWREVFLHVLTPEAARAAPMRAAARRLVDAEWPGRAAVGSAAYRLVRVFRLETQRLALDAVLAAAGPSADTLDLSPIRRLEGPLWRLVSERPAHLLAPGYDSWDAVLLAAADRAIASMAADGNLASSTWGEANRADIAHPLAAAMPVLRRWLGMPRDPLPGDVYMPRVGTPRSGASERFVASPGHEDQALLHMPGGQSGHPLSAHFADQQHAWVAGEPSPLLPGRPVHVLALTPAR